MFASATTSSNAASSGGNSNKFSSPPSIANVQRHEEWINLLRKYNLLTDDHDNSSQASASEIPLKLQSMANRYSLKPSREELALQEEIQALPRAGMAGAPDESNLLSLLLEMMNAKTVVEVGVFRGTTTLALAQTLQRLHQKNPAGRRVVIGLDVSSEFAEIGQTYWKKAGVQDLIDFRVGKASESLDKLLQDDEYGENAVDLCFIDADKTSYDDYYEKCVRLTKPGGLIVVDNTIWGGTVATSDHVLEALVREGQESDGSNDELVRATSRALDALAIKRLTEKIHADDRIERVCFLTIADGVTICRKK